MFHVIFIQLLDFFIIKKFPGILQYIRFIESRHRELLFLLPVEEILIFLHPIILQGVVDFIFAITLLLSPFKSDLRLTLCV